MLGSKSPLMPMPARYGITLARRPSPPLARLFRVVSCPTWGPGIANATPCPIDNSMHVRSSVGVGVIWESPFGPLRFDYSFPLSKQPYDQVQQFRFGGGTKF